MLQTTTNAQLAEHPQHSGATPLRRQDFSFALPPELIAQQPLARRSDSRLLSLDGESGALSDHIFHALPDLLNPGDLLVFNDTRVIPARLFGRKASGGRFELLIERILDAQRALVQLRASKAPQIGAQLQFDAGFRAVVSARDGDLFALQLAGDSTADWFSLLEEHGRMPLPPYITREVQADDQERYQTVYACHRGAVAAPTAGLHFDPALLDKLSARGVQQTFLTLHVGAGTFQPLRVERIAEHVMHRERVTISAATCAHIRQVQDNGGRIIAVGTTVTRALESATDADGVLQPKDGETEIFIYPGYRFRCVDALITNFHLPESTLLMLVAAFAGHEQTLRAYQHAVTQRYRFFSYGDAMFVTPPGQSHE